MEGFLRPTALVLSENALVPARNRISPAPNRFTHRVTTPAPFYFDSAADGKLPDGEFTPETRVSVLVSDGGAYCRVASEHGLYVDVEARRLEPL